MSNQSSSLKGVGRREALIIKTLTGVILFWMLLPILTVVVISFTASTTVQFPPPGFSLRWYERLAEMSFGPDAELMRFTEALLTSLKVALLSALVCLLIGLPAAYALTRCTFRSKSFVNDLIDLPVAFPAIVLGISLLIIVSALPFHLGLAQLVIPHAIISLPFMIRNIAASLSSFDASLEEAARTLGASPMRAFLEIILPIARNGIASGLMIVFILSFNEFTLTYFLSTVDLFPLSMWLFQQSNSTLDPTIFAVSTLIIAINAVVIVVVDRFAGGGAKISP
jgi:putative spermidine/putrescine transport system permease protein